MPFLIDTHAHVNFNAYKDDAEEVIRRSLDREVWMINVGSQFDTSKRAVEMAAPYEKGVYATAGMHPAHLFETQIDEDEVNFKSWQENFDYDEYKKLAQREKVAAIGECGIDYHYFVEAGSPSANTPCPPQSKGPTPINAEIVRKKQHETFRRHIDLAQELNLPLIIHCRDAHNEVLQIVKDYNLKNKAVVHCFTGALEEAKRYWELGIWVSFTGIITFPAKRKNPEEQEKLWEVVRQTPLDTLMLETDCPYLSPEPHRGKRNEPLYTEYIARKIAELKGETFEKIAEITTQNAIRFFNLESF